MLHLSCLHHAPCVMLQKTPVDWFLHVSQILGMLADRMNASQKNKSAGWIQFCAVPRARHYVFYGLVVVVKVLSPLLLLVA